MLGDQHAESLTLEDIPLPAVIGSFRIMKACNAAYCDLFGYDAAELIGKSFSMLYDNRSDFIDNGFISEHQVRQHLNYVNERVMRKADGTRFWCKVRGRAIASGRTISRVLYCVEEISRPADRMSGAITHRQRQILALVSQGRSNEEIGLELGISRRTVEAHRAKLMRELGVKNAAELMNWFIANDGAGRD